MNLGKNSWRTFFVAVFVFMCIACITANFGCVSYASENGDPAEAGNENIKKAEGELAAASEAATKAEEEITTLTAELEASKTAASAAQAGVDQAQKKYDSAASMAAYAGKGTLGLFEYHGSKAAANALQKAGTYRTSTSIGASNDATSIANMKTAISWIKKCNSLRANHGLSPLLVSDTMMAYAEYQTNASANYVGHTGVFNVGENLAWGYSDPFSGWYTEEKKMYDAGNRVQSEIGHYLNIINPSYKVTGFACNQKSSRYGTTHGQVFGFDTSGAMTVAQYEARFNSFCSAINSAGNLSGVQGELNNAKSNLSGAQTQLDDLTAKLSAAQSALDAANKEVEAKAQALEAVKAEEARKEQERIEKEKARIEEEKAQAAAEAAKKARIKKLTVYSGAAACVLTAVAIIVLVLVRKRGRNTAAR